MSGTEEDIKKIVESLLTERPETAKFMEECFLIGGAMFSMSIHYFVTRALSNNPETFAEKSNHRDSCDTEFKRKGGIRGMVDYLVDCCMRGGRRQKGQRTGRDLLAELRGEREHSTSGEPAEPPAKRRNLMAELREEEQEEAPKKKKSKKKN